MGDYMKTHVVIGVIISLIISFIISFLNVKANDITKTNEFNNLNTKNFVSEMEKKGITGVYKVCSYEYCDNVDSSNLSVGIKDFFKRYLDTINDEETKKSLIVKGLKITKIFYND